MKRSNENTIFKYQLSIIFLNSYHYYISEMAIDNVYLWIYDMHMYNRYAVSVYKKIRIIT